MDSKFLAAIKPAIVYCLVDPRFSGNAGRRYVGKTEARLGKRLRTHISEARTGKKTHRNKWIRALLKIGFVPLVTILELTTSIAACDKERGWIAYLRGIGCPLTNLTDGGDGTPGRKYSSETRAKSRGYKNALGKHWHLSEEDCARKSKVMMGNKNSLGCHPSEETLAKLRGNKNRLGHRHSEESIAKMRGNKNCLGRHYSEETKRKIGAAKMGNKNCLGKKNALGHHHTEEAKLRIGAANKGNKYALGHHHTEESIAKMRGNKNGLGHHPSEESLARMSAAQKARYANLRESKQAASSSLLPFSEATQ